MRTPRWHTGRGELFVAAGVIALAVILTIGTVTMTVPEETASPGPKFFPTLVAIFLYVVGVALAIEVLRHPKRSHVAEDPTEISNEMLEDLGDIDQTSEIRVVSPEDTIPEESNEQRVDWRTVGIVVAALAGFSLLLPLLGWLISSAALFWAIAWAFGSKRPLFDIAVSALVAAITQLAFSMGLGLSLPAGILEGAFSWIS
jgi:putative tricarboxylic transport membrane protein